MTRRLVAVALALVAAVGLLGTPVATREVRAATPDLTIVADARYDVQPAQHRVRVTLDPDAHEPPHRHEDHALLLRQGVPRGPARDQGVRDVLGRLGDPDRSRVSKSTKDYTLLRLGLAQRLYGGKTAMYRLRFDLPDPGGAATRDLRIGDSLVSFPVWAFGSDSTPGSVGHGGVPDGLLGRRPGRLHPEARDRRDRPGDLPRRAAVEPAVVLRLSRRRPPGAYATTTRQATVEGGPVALTRPVVARRQGVVQARRRPHGQGAAGPRRSEVGLAWPQAGTLTVHEAVSHSTGGYAGLFDPAKGVVEIAYYADPFVVLHESAHGWFNGSLLADRWANEGFASYYALQAAARPEGQGDRRRPDPKLKAARIPLNAWGPIGRDTGATEDYAYAASLALAKAIGERADARRAAVRLGGRGRPRRRLPAAVGRHARDRATAPPDWRGLLDLLEAESGNALRRPVADAGSPATRTCRCSMRGPPPGRATTQVVARCRRLDAAEAHPRRHAGLALRRRDPDARRGQHASSPGARRSRRMPRRSA